MDHRRLKNKPENNNDCYTNECKHCGNLMEFQWKIKISLKSKHVEGDESYHIPHAARHLENHCNEAGNISIQQGLIKKKVMKELNVKTMS